LADDLKVENEKKKKPLLKKWWFWVIVGFIGILMVAGSSNEDVKPTTSNSANQSDKTETEIFDMGNQIAVGNISYVVKSISEKTTLSNSFDSKTTQGKYLVINIDVTNNDKESRMIDTAMFKLHDSKERVFDPDSTLDMYVNQDLGFFLENLNPGISRNANIVFELPKDAIELKLELTSGFGWSGGESKLVKLN